MTRTVLVLAGVLVIAGRPILLAPLLLIVVPVVVVCWLGSTAVGAGRMLRYGGRRARREWHDGQRERRREGGRR